MQDMWEISSFDHLKNAADDQGHKVEQPTTRDISVK